MRIREEREGAGSERRNYMCADFLNLHSKERENRRSKRNAREKEGEIGDIPSPIKSSASPLKMTIISPLSSLFLLSLFSLFLSALHHRRERERERERRGERGERRRNEEKILMKSDKCRPRPYQLQQLNILSLGHLVSIKGEREEREKLFQYSNC